MTIYRDPSNNNAIPSYEGQPMIMTLTQQFAAANAIMIANDDIINNETNDYDVLLFVNNFSG